ncbi:MAG: hypothetical protein M3R00_06740 [Pseudomonadota bacterium]|nr:hypothetical protein [Pseudomonadota bacterium]
MYTEDENTGCISNLKRCWATFFHERNENEIIRLMHPTAEYSCLVTNPESLDDTAEGITMWQHYVENRYNLSDESQYQTFSQDTFIMTCYTKLLTPASHGDKDCIAILDKFPGKLRLLLDAKIHERNQLTQKL